MTLVVMAAGMGSRYGGLKQLDPIGKNSEFILDFSVYDAIKAGFDKVVFVIKKENLELFRDTVGKRIEGHIKVDYAFQSVDALPKGYSVPEGRTKPWGTAHAVLAAKPYVDGPFAAINADDFYGADSFKILADYLRANKGVGKYCMAGFILKNTLTENGSVARGICETDSDGNLTEVTERTKILRDGKDVVWVDDGERHVVSEDSIVSMNCWGFSGGFLEQLDDGFKAFLDKNAENLTKCEYYLPFAVREQMAAGTAKVKVLTTTARWYGVTYHEDRQTVVDAIQNLRDKGVYPDKLWN